MNRVSSFMCIAGIGCGAMLVTPPAWSQPDLDAARQAQGFPTTIVPAPVIPSPNAHDYFLRAGAVLADKEKFGTKLTPEENALLVAKNVKALRILREGFAHQHQFTTGTFDEAAFKSYADFRALARLLIAEGQTHASRGDKGRAAQSYLDVLRFGIEISYGSPLLGGLVGTAIESIGRHSLWEISGQLDAESARQIARRLEIIEARRYPFAETVRHEQAVGETQLRVILQAMNPPWDEQQTMARFGSLMAAEVVKARIPYIASGQQPAVGKMEKNLADFEMAADANATERIDALFASSKSVIDSSRFFFTKNQTQNALLLVTLALRAYHLEHGHYPASLTRLVPEYFEQTPTDPFSLKEPLQYKVDGDKYLLYSLGPDGKDDLGLPVEAGDTKNIQADSKGDIVAGVNQR